VLKYEHLSLDATDVSSLVGERYISGFCISVVCLKYLEEARQQGCTGFVFLPTTAQTWISSIATLQAIEDKIGKFLDFEDLKNLTLVLIPIHVRQCHWGLLCLDVCSKKLFYDDGLHWAPPNNTVRLAKQLLNALKEMSVKLQTGSVQDLDKDKWDLSFSRFAMPD
jgi:hypothetical protein